jgi:SRSO17 transposase
VLCIDETGDRKQGHTTDYAASQYLGGPHRVEQGIVSVNAYGVLDHVTFPLAFALYKPKTRLKPGDRFQTHDEARSAVFDWIEIFSNRQRRHSALGYGAPVVYEQTVTAPTSGAA